MAFRPSIGRIWAIRRQEARRVMSGGKVEVKLVGRRIHVTCVHRDAFSQGALELCGRWRERSQCWSFSAAAQRLIIELCERVYGKEAIVKVGFPPERPVMPV